MGAPVGSVSVGMGDEAVVVASGNGAFIGESS